MPENSAKQHYDLGTRASDYGRAPTGTQVEPSRRVNLIASQRFDKNAARITVVAGATAEKGNQRSQQVAYLTTFLAI